MIIAPLSRVLSDNFAPSFYDSYERFIGSAAEHRRDAYATFRSVYGSRTSPSPKYHRRLACVPITARGDDRKPESQNDWSSWPGFQPLMLEHRRDAYATFRSICGSRTSPSPKYHRRLACVPITARGDDRKPESQNEFVLRFQP
jgi:hypothetical protein